MSRESLRVPVFAPRYRSATPLPILLIFIVSFGAFTPGSSRNFHTTQLAELDVVKFAVPPGFQLEQSGTNKVSFMRNTSEPLGLFVTVPEQELGDKYLTDLSDALVSLLQRGENGFRWKIQTTVDSRVSRYQTHRGNVKGLKEKVFVQIDYVVVRAQNKNVVIGSIAQFGEESKAPFLFEVEGREYSVRGWQALFQLISSVTGEKENELQ